MKKKKRKEPVEHLASGTKDDVVLGRDTRRVSEGAIVVGRRVGGFVDDGATGVLGVDDELDGIVGVGLDDDTEAGDGDAKLAAERGRVAGKLAVLADGLEVDVEIRSTSNDDRDDRLVRAVSSGGKDGTLRLERRRDGLVEGLVLVLVVEELVVVSEEGRGVSAFLLGVKDIKETKGEFEMALEFLGQFGEKSEATVVPGVLVEVVEMEVRADDGSARGDVFVDKDREAKVETDITGRDGELDKVLADCPLDVTGVDERQELLEAVDDVLGGSVDVLHGVERHVLSVVDRLWV